MQYISLIVVLFIEPISIQILLIFLIRNNIITVIINSIATKLYCFFCTPSTDNYLMCMVSFKSFEQFYPYNFGKDVM